MANMNKIFLLRSKTINTHSIFLRFSGLVGGILFVVFVIGCIPKSTPARNCFPTSVFTTEDMRARVDCHPDDYKMEITKDTVVLFAFPDPVIDWASSIFIIHIPSVSEVTLNTDGSIFSEDYKSLGGRNAIENVLDNRELITRILERSKEIWK
jgi:hypothetical protein